MPLLISDPTYCTAKYSITCCIQPFQYRHIAKCSLSNYIYRATPPIR